MLIPFFYTLREAKLPVSVKEYLTLLEALKAGVIGPSIDDFYFLSRITLVKDEAHFDRFDQAFGAFFNGVAKLTDSKEIPEDWLRQLIERDLTPEQKAAISAHMPLALVILVCVTLGTLFLYLSDVRPGSRRPSVADLQ